MSRIRNVGGKIIEKIGGDYKIYSRGDITYNSTQKIINIGKEGGVVFGELEQYNHMRSCNYTPKPVKVRGCDYYILRVKDFFKRHPECKHFPPEYYYGPMRIPCTLSKGDKEEIRLSELNKNKSDEYKNMYRTREKIEAYRAKEDPNQPTFIKKNNDISISYTGTLEESYGTKYCNAFTKLRPDLTKEGQIWLDNTLLKLQELMENGVVDRYYVAEYNKAYNKRNKLVDGNGDPVEIEIINNFYTTIELFESRFEDFAFATHPDAYAPKDMEKLPLHDLLRIGFTPGIKELFNPETQEQIRVMIENIDIGEIIKSTREKIKEDTRKYIEESSGKIKEKLKKHWDKIFN